MNVITSDPQIPSPTASTSRSFSMGPLMRSRRARSQSSLEETGGVWAWEGGRAMPEVRASLTASTSSKSLSSYSLKFFTKSFLSHRVGEIDEDTKSLGACSIDSKNKLFLAGTWSAHLYVQWLGTNSWCDTIDQILSVRLLS